MLNCLLRRFVGANICKGGESGEGGGRSSQKGMGKMSGRDRTCSCWSMRADGLIFLGVTRRGLGVRYYGGGGQVVVEVVVVVLLNVYVDGL